MKWAKQKGFTIVELLIVVVVIAILAAITIVSYNGIQSRATKTAIESEISQNVRKIMSVAAASSTGRYATTDVMAGGEAVPTIDKSKYKVLSYCTNGTDFIFAAQTTSGQKYYTRSNSTVLNDNTIDAFSPCTHFSIAGANLTYMNLPPLCATQGASCSFTGTATLVYGSETYGQFVRHLNRTGPVDCNDGLTDPSYGNSKRCFVYPN